MGCPEDEQWEEEERQANRERDGDENQIKMLMGRGLEDLEKMVKELPYKIIETDRKLIKVKIFDKEFSPQELSAEILKFSADDFVRRNFEIFCGRFCPLKFCIVSSGLDYGSPP